jgi:glycerol kinase
VTDADRFVVAIDQGTTSTRCVVVDREGRFVAVAQKEHGQGLPRPGWVEHDAAEIWANTEEVVSGAMDGAGIMASQVACVGLTNQRETTVAWDRSGHPLSPAIVWQDTRTAAICRRLGGEAGPDRFRDETGLPLATYFAGPKMAWLLENDRNVAAAAEAGTLRFGTIDSWLVSRLTGRHVTDVTNAGRTMLMSLDSLDWDPGLLGAFGIPIDPLPEIVPSLGRVAGVVEGPLKGVPVAGILGDQQAALVGQRGLSPGDAKNTYGTGCFMLLNTGTDRVRSDHGLLTTVAYQAASEATRYALEGSVAVAGSAVQWLRDNLGLIDEAAQVEELANQVEDNGGVYFVPAFSGLFAPHWRPDARGLLAGMTRFTSAGHIARAVLEAVAFQTRDVVAAMQVDSAFEMSRLLVDGGMVGNDLLMQVQADVLGIPVVRPANVETTVLGAAFAAGLAVGFWDDETALPTGGDPPTEFVPAMDEAERAGLLAGWAKALERSLGWVEEA